MRTTPHNFLFIRGLFLFFVTCILVQCKQASPEQIKIDNRHQEIMAVHDDVMPKMKDIYQIKKKLKQLAASDEIDQIINELEAADESMMSWMHQYKKPKAGSDSVNSYLDDQEEYIESVRNQMLAAIDKAQKYVEDE